jgi:nitrite reductase/ring-hydroxylating ferredoxin subunit
MLKFKIKWRLAFPNQKDLEVLFGQRDVAVSSTPFGRVLWVRHMNTLHAFKNKCPHQNKPLDHCWLDGGDIVCPFHRFHFSIEDGRGMATSMYKYEVKVSDEAIWLGKEVLGLSFSLKVRNRRKIKS